jgi:hypothetical protein
MNWDAIKVYLDIGQALMTGAVWIYVVISNRQKVNKVAIDRVDARVGDLGGRIMVLEDRVRHSPTHDDLGKLYERMNSVNAEMQHMNGHLEAMRRQFEMVNEYLLNGSKR